MLNILFRRKSQTGIVLRRRGKSEGTVLPRDSVHTYLSLSQLVSELVNYRVVICIKMSTSRINSSESSHFIECWEMMDVLYDEAKMKRTNQLRVIPDVMSSKDFLRTRRSGSKWARLLNHSLPVHGLTMKRNCWLRSTDKRTLSINSKLIFKSSPGRAVSDFWSHLFQLLSFILPVLPSFLSLSLHRLWV